MFVSYAKEGDWYLMTLEQEAEFVRQWKANNWSLEGWLRYELPDGLAVIGRGFVGGTFKGFK